MVFKTIILDLDNTLLHTPLGDEKVALHNCSLHSVFLSNTMITFFRPGLDYFLNFLFDNNYRVIIWTAGAEIYAKEVVDKIFNFYKIDKRPYAVFSRTLVEECEIMTQHHKLIDFLKTKVTIIDDPLIIDDRVDVYLSQPQYAYQIHPFNVNNRYACTDNELIKIVAFLKKNNNK